MPTFTTCSAEETRTAAKKIASKHKDGAIIALSGPLGAGKTTFVQGFAKGLGIKQKILSPTFIIVRQYKIPNSSGGKFYHIDLYRLNSISQMENLGLEEIFINPQNIILIEWAKKLGKLLPKETVMINLKILSPAVRKISVIE